MVYSTRGFVVLLRKSNPQNHALQTAVEHGVKFREKQEEIMKFLLSTTIMMIGIFTNVTSAEVNTKKNTVLYGYAMYQIAQSFCNKSISMPAKEIEFVRNKIKNEPETRAVYDQMRLSILNTAEEKDICLIVAQYESKQNPSENVEIITFKNTNWHINEKYNPGAMPHLSHLNPSHLFTGYVYNQSDKNISSISVRFKFYDCPQKNNCFIVNEQQAELYNYGAPTPITEDLLLKTNRGAYKLEIQKRTRKHFVAFLTVPEHTDYEMFYTYTFSQ